VQRRVPILSDVNRSTAVARTQRDASVQYLVLQIRIGSFCKEQQRYIGKPVPCCIVKSCRPTLFVVHVPASVSSEIS
jgi:hypothetical protein